MSVPRFLVSSEALTGARTCLTGTELRHLRIRRLRVADELVLFDGLGRERSGILESLDRRQAVIRLRDADGPQRESPLHLVLAQALLKADKLDFVVEKATELGAAEVVIFTCERTIGQPSAHRLARWSRIARSAAKQCQRSTVPRLTGPVTFNDLLLRTDLVRLFFWEDAPPADIAALGEHPLADGSVLAVVGPEGGFAATEAERATRAGFRPLGLTQRILRAETAAIVVLTLCQFLWGDLGHRRH